MDRRHTLKIFVRKAKRSLNIERMLRRLQIGVLLALSLCAAILLVSRLFVFPYYRDISIIVSALVLAFVILYIWLKRVRDKEALIRLDSYYPHNELVTALSLERDGNPLVNSLLQKAQTETPSSFGKFKKRKKTLWKPKILIGIVLVSIFIGILSIFPSATQTEALVYEKEQDVIKKVEKEVKDLEKKAETKEAKKQLQELQEKLKEVETSEEALREVVKKQKELKLQEQKLKDKETLANQDEAEAAEGLSAEEQAKLEELMEMQKGLASTANQTQSSLSKLGKPISFDLQNAIASELGSEFNEASEINDNSEEENDEQSNNEDSQQQENNNQSSNQGDKGQGQGQGSNSGASQNGQGQGSGSKGNGQGTGTGGSGAGNGGKGAGLGQGSRDLLSIPNRIGGSSETTADGGKLGEGTAVGEQKGSVPVTRGTVRPYEEAIGQYKDSFMESSDRMQLPKDLQDIVQSYFSSIEAEE